MSERTKNILIAIFAFICFAYGSNMAFEDECREAPDCVVDQ